MYEDALFHQVLEQPPAERAAFLDKVCADDHALRQRVEALLHAHDNPGDFLAHPAVPQEQTVDEPRLADQSGSRIGPYKLLQQIGEGGMGTVFMAEQTEPVRRRVALKVIKAGMDTRQVVARFEAERQALAMMDHPNIAKVLDAGATDSGRPYFVMELVKGVLITKYCDEHRLTPQQRLELFIPVCQAVQHAHQKGIIHRDLKPSNVLIALYDGKPVPKVIDFGVAKAVGGGLTDKTLYTDFGAMVGTLEYMSPEQAEPNQLDIDTRSDLYALGVLLYELLTGTTPFERKRLRAAAMLECLRIIREEEPQKPSTRLSTADQLPSVAANRGLEPRKLTGVVRGDLDWIVMKCLEKDRNRRYETANGLAIDVQRYLADEPVLANPPSAAYRLRKFARRHKAGLLTTTTALVVLLLAGVGGGWVIWDWAAQRTTTEQAVNNALVKAEQSERRAKERPNTTSVEAKAALAEWHDAAAALAEAEVALMTGAPPNRVRERVAEVRQRIEQGQTQAARKEKLFRDLDDARMALATVKEAHYDRAGAAAKYAAAFATFGLEVQSGQTEALAQRIRAEDAAVRDALIVGLDHWAACVTTSENTDLLVRADLLAIARATDQDAWRRHYRQAVVERDGAALVLLSGEARRLPLPPASLELLAIHLIVNGQGEEAVDLLRWARGLHPTDFWIALELGDYLAEAKASEPAELEERIGCFRVAVALRPDASAAHNNLGNALRDKNQLDDAIAEYHKAIALDPKYALAYHGLGVALARKNQLDDAIAEYRKAITFNPKDALAHFNLGAALAHKNQLDDAIAEYHRAIDLDPKHAPWYYNLGDALKANFQLDDAIAEYQKAVTLDPKSAMVHVNLGVALEAKNKLDDAIAEFHTAIALDPKSAASHYNLGNALKAKNQLDDAVAEFKKAIEIDPKLAPAHSDLGSALYAKDQLDDATAEFKKAIALDPNDAKAHSNLGITLHSKNQLDDAIAEYHKAIALDAKDAKAHNNLGFALQAKNQLDDAIAEYHKAIDLDPKHAAAHYNLGNALRAKNQVDDAIAAYRKAIDLDPKYAEAHCNLGHVLRDQGKLAEAVAELRLGDELGRKKLNWSYPSAEWVRAAESLLALDDRRGDLLRGETAGVKAADLLAYAVFRHGQGKLDEAIALLQQTVVLQPDLADAHGNLSWLLQEQGKWDRAAAAAQKAIELNPRAGWYHSNYGWSLENLGQLEEALAEYRQALHLPNNGNASANLRNLEPFVALIPRLEAVRKGEAKPTDAVECLQLAQVAKRKKQWVLATRLYENAFTDKPHLAVDLMSGNRYNAACYAALAAAGQGKDADKLDDKDRARLRKQAVEWLRADLALWTERARSDGASDRELVQKTLKHWQDDPDLAGIRDKDAVAKLPAEEREACQKLWADVTELPKKTSEAK